MEEKWQPFGSVVTRQRPERRTLWTLTQGDKQIEASLLIHVAGGCELQLTCNGVFYKGKRFDSLPLAVNYGDKVRRDCVALEWRDANNKEAMPVTGLNEKAAW